MAMSDEDVYENVLTRYLSERFPEVTPMEFYRDLFPAGSLASAPHDGPEPYPRGTYNGVLVRVLKTDDGSSKAERHFVLDPLENVRSVLVADGVLGAPMVHDFLSPVSYSGRRPLLSAAHELFALTFDLDGVAVNDGDPVGLKDLLYQMSDVEGRPALLPTPTYLVSSGTGLHLYYMLDEPLRLWPNVVEHLSEMRYALTKRLWNRYVTDLHDRRQFEGVVQAFRMVGSRAKDGVHHVRAFRTGGRASIDELNEFVPEPCRVTPEIREATHTLAEARELWPEWDPDWRRKATAAPRSPWRVKRDLYDWWCRRVESGEPFEGNRYWCVFVAACYAAKCPEVTYEELEAWAHRVRPMLDRVTTRDDNHFTDADVQAALAAYGNPLSVKLRRDKVAEKTQLPMPVNKRNGRKLDQHVAYLNSLRKMRRDVLGEDEYKNSGRPTKADEIRFFAIEHPDASHSEIARVLGVSRPTVIKWLKPGWREEWGAKEICAGVGLTLRRDEEG